MGACFDLCSPSSSTDVLFRCVCMWLKIPNWGLPDFMTTINQTAAVLILDNLCLQRCYLPRVASLC